ncbi:MAG: MFS transporter [Anaerolineae bacterium]|jgi:GPH family glycoside/pentoside/hexuronide:cation symporter|nr:MFS transporter [Anaerolineae bacterium]
MEADHRNIFQKASDGIKKGLNKRNNPGEITFKEKFFLAFPTMPVSLSNVLIHNAFLKYYTDMVGMPVEKAGLVYLIFSIWNAINDPLMGVFIDRFRYTKERGKFVYIMKMSVPVTVFSALLMIYAQPGWSEWLIFAWFLALLFFFDTTQTAYSIALTSYKLIAAPTNRERIDVSVINTYVANIGGLFGTLVPTLLLVGESQRNLTILWFTVAVALNGVLYWLALKPLKDTAEMYKHELDTEEGELVKQVKENALDALKSRSFIVFIIYQFIGKGPYSMYFTPFLYLMDYVLKLNGFQATLVDIIPGILLFTAAPFIGKFAKKVGSKRSMVYSAIPTAIGFALLYFIENIWHALIAYTIMIVFTNVSNIAYGAMMGAIIDEDEMKTGTRKAGLYNGLNALLTIPVGGMQTAIFTAIVGYFGFVSGAEVQSDQAVMGIRIAAGLVAAAFTLLGIIPISFSTITKEKEEELSVFSESRHRGGDPAATSVEL